MPSYSGDWFIVETGIPPISRGQFEYFEQIARFAPLPYPPPVTRRPPAEAWIVTYTGQCPIFLASPHGDHEWQGSLILYFTGSGWAYNPEQSPRAIQYGYTDAAPPSVVRHTNRGVPFEGFPVAVAISGTNEEQGATYGIGPKQARIESSPPVNLGSWVPSRAALRLSLELGLAVWGAGATLSSVSFEVTVTAEFEYG